MNQPQILSTTWPYFQKLLTYHGLINQPAYHDAGIWGGEHRRVSGYDDYNRLLDIHACFSTRPSGDTRDRTGSVRFPFRMASAGAWQRPVSSLDLASCFSQRVQHIHRQHAIVNLLWSGGIDSTAMVVAWLQQASPGGDIRILYTRDSKEENPSFFSLLQRRRDVQLIDMDRIDARQPPIEGVEVHGGAADYLTAHVEEDFFHAHGFEALQGSWRDFFFRARPDQAFMDFCEQWFSLSGRDITTLLQARWWFFYNQCPPAQISTLAREPMAVSFFDHVLFDRYFYHNMDSLFGDRSWTGYKRMLKNYIHAFCPDQEYLAHKSKQPSGGYLFNCMRKRLLCGTESIMTLSDGSQIRTPNLPFLSQKQYRASYAHTLDHLFGPPN